MRRIFSFLILISFFAAASFAVVGSYENYLVDRISNSAVSEQMTKVEKVDALLKVTSRLLDGRHAFYKELELDISLPGVIGQLLLPSRNCGGYSRIFMALTHAVGIESRFVQMLCEGYEGACHIIVETEIDGKWIAVDPLFGFYFVTPAGGPATFAEISSDWNFYSKQVPDGYTAIYRYEGRRGTNWDKFPGFFLVRNFLSFFIEEVSLETFSLRTYFRSIWYVASGVLLGVSLLLFIIKKIFFG